MYLYMYFLLDIGIVNEVCDYTNIMTKHVLIPSNGGGRIGRRQISR